MKRRWFLLAGAALPLIGGGAFWLAASQGAAEVATAMAPPELKNAVDAGDVLLVDIRRPEEWEATGIAEGAVPIDLRRDDFVAAILAARASSDQPVALICAAGVRSRRMTHVLSEAGLTQIIDVPEGMMGSGAGPGWIERGLPVISVE